MPKGDRLRLKADPEDGTTPIANLLLEAVAMAKLSGLQKGAIVYLWRQTYGWMGEDGKRLKEAKISLSEWNKALDKNKSNISKALSELEVKGIMQRRVADIWGGYYYSINTDITKWNSQSLNLSKLAETVGIVDFATVGKNATVDDKTTVGDNTNSNKITNSCPVGNATVGKNATQQLVKTQPTTLYKESLNKVKERDNDKSTTTEEMKITKIFGGFADNFQRVTPSIRDKLSDFIQNYGSDKVLYALDEAIKYNKRNLAYIEAILEGKGNKKQQTGKLPTTEELIRQGKEKGVL